jgi:branched-chain amino acid transport system ATP-binding protein
MKTSAELIKLQGVHAGYGDAKVLFDLSMVVAEGECVALLGRNGAGKTTTMRTIIGLSRITAGEVLYEGKSIRGRSTFALGRAGLGMVPEDRRIFAELTVVENLEIAARTGRPNPWTVERALEFFPELKAHVNRRGGVLSGGQQQMLTIARTLMTNPRVLLLDEPSEGLAPLIVERILDRVKELRRAGLTILLAEHNLRFSLALSDRVYVLERGQVKYTGTAKEFAGNAALQEEMLSI